MSIENAFPKTLNNSWFTILIKKFYYSCISNCINQIVSTVCLTKFDLTNFSVFFSKLHKYYMFDDYFQKTLFHVVIA